MSAAVGHLSHLIEGVNFTFGDIKQILSDAFNGSLEGATEKFDGMNLVFTWDINTDGLRVARKASDIPSGGMGAPELAMKFAGRGHVEAAFNDAFRVLTAAVNALTNEEKLVAFGSDAYRWYSIEIIHQVALNTIKYDGNHIVFHSWPVFERSPAGVLKGIKNSRGLKIFETAIERMQAQVTSMGFEVHGPAYVKLVQSSNVDLLKKQMFRIDQLIDHANVTESTTLLDYMVSEARSIARHHTNSPQAIEALSMKLADHPNALHANNVKKLFPGKLASVAGELMKGREHWQASWLYPIERAIFHVATEVLSHVPSLLVKDSDAEVKRLRGVVADALDWASVEQTQEVIEFVRKHVQNMESINNISSPMEGIVFMRGDEAYKLTGAFSSAHQIIALRKYGRKGVTDNERKSVQRYPTDLIRRA